MKKKGALTHLVVSTEKEEKRINKQIAKRSGLHKNPPRHKVKHSLKDYFQEQIPKEYDPENAEMSELDSLGEQADADPNFQQKRLFNEFNVSQEYQGKPISRVDLNIPDNSDSLDSEDNSFRGSSEQESQIGEELEQEMDELQFEDEQALNQMEEDKQSEMEKSQAI